MLRDITLGQYMPGNTIVHRLDPRTKILLTIVYIAMIFCVSSPVWYVIPLIFVALCAKLSGITVKQLVKTIKPLRILLLISFVLNLFFVQGETVILDLGFWALTKEALQNAIYFALRLVFLVMGTSVLTLTTSPIALSDGIEMLLSPLKKLHFPAHELAMMMSIALRFIRKKSRSSRPWPTKALACSKMASRTALGSSLSPEAVSIHMPSTVSKPPPKEPSMVPSS